MIEEIRNGSGPQFLEIQTYRFRGHSMGDPERYRKQEEVHEWRRMTRLAFIANIY
jgi:pyruvate dehydrogenase E1 component alpha subunit